VALETVIITWNELDVGLGGVAGVITFALSQPLTDTTDGQIVEPVPERYPFSSSTGTSGPLTANDNASALPSGTYYTVTVNIQGLPSRSFTAPVNHANGASQTLAFLQSQAIVPSQPMSSYLETTGGTMTGPLALDGGLTIEGVAIEDPPGGTSEFLRADGTFAVPPGGSGAVSSVFGRTGAVVAQSGDYTAAEVGADPAGSASTAQGNAETYAAAQASAAQSAAEAASDPAGSAAAAQAAAEAASVPLSDLPLSVAHGGTGSGSQNFVDLTSGQSIGGIKTFTGEVVVPAPVNAGDAIPKSYADAIAQGLSVKPSVQEATTAALPSNTYSAGVLTAAANGALTVDGIAVAVNDRVLAQNEAAAANNGIYVVTATGSAGAKYVLTRAADMAAGSQVPGAFCFCEQGTVNAGAGFVVASEGPFTIGTTSIPWTQFSGAGEITAGAGLAKSGNTLSIGASPALTGVPTAPTASALTSTTQLATTAYADSATAVEKARALAAEALLAPLASPALTGTPTAPTKTALTSSTAVATTAYADSAVAVETSRAETAEALALPLTGGTMSGAIAMGSNKITGLANGSGAQDAAAFGQIPTALPPDGTAGGDLSGTYPNPAAAKVNGTSVPATPAAGQLIRATGTTAAAWTSEMNLYLAPTGATAETFPRRWSTTPSSVGSSGTLYVTGIAIPAGVVVNNITFCTSTAAKTGGTHGWYVLLDSSRVVRAVTADQTDAATVWGTINTAYTLATNAYTTTYSGLYYVGVMVAETAGTMPTFTCLTGQTTVTNSLVPVLTGASSTGQTTPPATGATMTAITPSSREFYAYTS
jgi:hypothetical protein